MTLGELLITGQIMWSPDALSEGSDGSVGVQLQRSSIASPRGI